jgi:hypothetical protein
LVCEREGEIAGFLGVMPRRMLFRGRLLLMAVCSQFVVNPGDRGRVGLQMLKRCFAGPQDLSVTDEAGDNTRRIWEWCGGATILPHSLHWITPLRFFKAAPAIIREHHSIVVPTARRRPDRGFREAVDTTALLAAMSELVQGRALVPAYEPHTRAWIVARASNRPDHGRLRQVLVRDAHGITAGFAYCLTRNGVVELLQLGAKPDAVGNALDHLFEDARQQGANAVRGRLDSALAPELSGRGCLLYRRGHWSLIHSRHTDLLHAVHSGDAFLSRLEGEWCLRYP